MWRPTTALMEMTTMATVAAMGPVRRLKHKQALINEQICVIATGTSMAQQLKSWSTKKHTTTTTPPSNPNMCASMVVIFIIICLTWFYVISYFAAHSRFEWSETFYVNSARTSGYCMIASTHKHTRCFWSRMATKNPTNSAKNASSIADDNKNYTIHTLLAKFFDFIVFTSIKLKCLLIKIAAHYRNIIETETVKGRKKENERWEWPFILCIMYFFFIFISLLFAVHFISFHSSVCMCVVKLQLNWSFWFGLVHFSFESGINITYITHNNVCNNNNQKKKPKRNKTNWN